MVSHKPIVLALGSVLVLGGTTAVMVQGGLPIFNATHTEAPEVASKDSDVATGSGNPQAGNQSEEEKKKATEEQKKAAQNSAKKPGSPTSNGGTSAGPQPTPSTPSSPAAGTWPPTPQSVGVPAGTVLTAYTGPCDIYTPNTVIDKKVINCVDFRIMTTGVTITKSKINGAIRVGTQDDYEPTVISDPEGDDPIRLTLLDSEVDATLSVNSGFRPISSSHYIMRNSYVHGSYSGGECHNACTIENSYLHGFGEHSSGLRVLRNAVIRNNTIWCEPNPNSDEDLNGIPDPDGGCSGNMTMYEEFGVPHNNLIEHNYFPAGLFWYSLKFNGNDNGNIRIVNNLFGIPKSGAGVADGWDVKPSNIWSGNTFTNGQVANP